MGAALGCEPLIIDLNQEVTVHSYENDSRAETVHGMQELWLVLNEEN